MVCKKQSLSAGVYIYTNGQHTLSFQGLHYNDYYHLDREAAVKVYSDDPILSVKYRDTSFPGDGIASQPFIEYEIIDKHGDNTDFYYVTISGEVSPLQTLYDMDDGVLIKKETGTARCSSRYSPAMYPYGRIVVKGLSLATSIRRYIIIILRFRRKTSTKSQRCPSKTSQTSIRCSLILTLVSLIHTQISC